MAEMIGHNGGPRDSGNGWFVIHRSMIDHPVVGFGQPVKAKDERRGAYSRAEAWIWLIQAAAYAEHVWRGKDYSLTLDPGQLVGGRKHLSEVWNWPEKVVRGFLGKLQAELMITLATDEIRAKRRANTPQLITLCNYLQYQLKEEAEGPTEGPTKGQQRANEGPTKGQIINKDKQTLSDLSNDKSSPRAEDAGPANQALPLALEGEEPFDVKAFNRRLTETAFEDYLDLARRVGLTEHKPSTLKQLRSDIVRRMREHADDPQSFESMIGVWREALRKIEISAFLQGDNPRGWKADLNFLCQKSSFRKVYDGGYGNGAHAKPRQPGEVSEAEREATLRRYAALAGGSW